MSKLEFSAASLLLLILGGFFLGFSGSVDDAHITFAAADIFARHDGVLNYNLERVEQSSALLQVVVLGLLRKASGLPVVMLGHVLTIAAAIATLFFTGKLGRKSVVGGGPVLLLASSPFFVYWAFGGMEGPWLSLLLVLLFLQLPACLVTRGFSVVVLLLSWAAQMTRPEMPVLLCLFAAALLPLRVLLKSLPWRWRSLMVFLCLQLLLAVLLSAWRWWYFGDIFPQPVRAKTTGFSSEAFTQGLQYVGQTWLDIRLLPMALLAMAGIVLTLLRNRQPLPLLMVLFVLIYAGFIVASGGDWMAAGRFWTPVMPLLAVLVMSSLDFFHLGRKTKIAVLLLLMTANVTYLWRGVGIDFNGVPLWKKHRLTEGDQPQMFSFFERQAREHLHDIPTLAYARPLLEKILVVRKGQKNSAPVVIMAGQMGMVPFYLSQDFEGRLRFIDRNGITERTLTRCTPAAGLPRTRNGIGTGYEWIVANRSSLESACGFVMPDVIFDIEAGWNRHNIVALQEAGYVFVYRQRGHVFFEPADAWLPLRRIGAGQFIAVSHTIWQQLGEPSAVERVF